jgi:anti-anti-sigma factor
MSKSNTEKQLGINRDNDTKIITSIEGNTLFLRIIGELSIYNVEEINGRLCILFGNAQTIIIDMSKADRLDVAGFQLLASLKESCVNMNKEFELIEVGESISYFFTLFGFLIKGSNDYFGTNVSHEADKEIN